MSINLFSCLITNLNCFLPFPFYLTFRQLFLPFPFFFLPFFTLQRPRSCHTMHPMVRPGWLSTLCAPATTWTWSSLSSSVSMSSRCLWSTTASHRWEREGVRIWMWVRETERQNRDFFLKRGFWVGVDTPSVFFKWALPEANCQPAALNQQQKNSQQPKH